LLDAVSGEELEAVGAVGATSNVLALQAVGLAGHAAGTLPSITWWAGVAAESWDGGLGAVGQLQCKVVKIHSHLCLVIFVYTHNVKRIMVRHHRAKSD